MLLRIRSSLPGGESHHHHRYKTDTMLSIAHMDGLFQSSVFYTLVILPLDLDRLLFGHAAQMCAIHLRLSHSSL